MNLDRIKIVLVLFAIFASLNTILAIYSQSQFGGPECTNPPCANRSPLAIYSTISVPISVATWLIFGATFALWRRSSSNIIRFSMMKAGFDRSVYDLMVKMRGSSSRLSILQSLIQAPHHRNELSEITGIDWKEVDRQIGLLERYGFVSVEAQAGPVKVYKLTEQGRSLVKLMDELGKNQTSY